VRVEVTLDCADPDRLAQFWGPLLGCVPTPVVAGEYVAVEYEAFTLTLQRVPEPKTVKNRMHLDLVVEDLAATVARVEALGGARLTADGLRLHGERWFVMADPEGNEFCLAQLRAATGSGGGTSMTPAECGDDRPSGEDRVRLS
jgi:predicted enzyme related to lactoylglutathione lyase